MDSPARAPDPMDHDGVMDWDEMYSEHDQVWSGRPNPALKVEVQGMAPSTVLDVGCGEGADAVWLAKKGWTVTALDVSQVALTRAARAVEHSDADVTWVKGPLQEFSGGPFGLVVAMYPALPVEGSVEALLRCVQPAGTLLVVGHAHVDPGHGHREEFLRVDQIATALDDQWVIEADDQRPRIDPPPGAEHVFDIVLRARRKA